MVNAAAIDDSAMIVDGPENVDATITAAAITDELESTSKGSSWQQHQQQHKYNK